MRSVINIRHVAAFLVAALATSAPTGFAFADDTALIDTMFVTTQRSAEPLLERSGNLDQVDAAEIDWTGHHHINELLDRIAGAWIVRGSGQDHQTAIRSPVLGGAGSCGGFLILEDGIPTRPAGFCNSNQLIEVNAEQAQSVEVIRGPGNALFGSNALHGIINVSMPNPGEAPRGNVGVELGSNDYIRLRGLLPFDAESPWLAAINLTDDGGFRDDSGFRQGKLHVKRGWQSADDSFVVAMTATDLDQETAGFITGEDAYKDELLSRTNPNPEAYREATSARLYGIWKRRTARADLDVRPYLRRSSMEFLHHALPGQPVEHNGQVSAGVITSLRFATGNWQTVTGLNVEWSNAYLRQTQFGPTTGPPRQRATRPVGKHYDYDVDALVLAAFVQSEYQLSDAWSVGGGLRLERSQYDYRNNMLAGNTRDDGTACGSGGCLYTRPEDRRDSFTNLVPNLSARYRIGEQTILFASVARGFRAPQTLELYRLQNGQDVADLDSEHIDSLELGMRTRREKLAAEVVAFTMRKRDSIFRDAEGFNVVGGRSRHSGIEANVSYRLAPRWQLSANASYARHTYDFSFSGRGESIVSGNDIDTAPRWLGGGELSFEPRHNVRLGLQVSHLGEYYVDPSNTRRYPGHTLANLRAVFRLSENYALSLRLHNLFDTRYASRADFAQQTFRYLPGRSREAFIELRYQPGS